MDAHQRRIEEARARNLEYIRRLDEKEAARAADDFLRDHLGGEQRKKPAQGAGSGSLKNTSVYITGLTTYMACKQLEGMCSKLGKVRRIKFYKSESGGLKGDALVTFASHGMMAKAVERLNHFEIKPGVIITTHWLTYTLPSTESPSATEAQFKHTSTTNSNSQAATDSTTDQTTDTGQQPQQPQQPERLFGTQVLLQDDQEDADKAAVEASALPRESDSDMTLALPSRSVILKHVWDPLAPQEDATKFFSELEDDMKHECGKHGALDQVHILPTGAVVVRFTTLPSAIKCKQTMHGRWFDGRQLEAAFDPSTPEDPSDDATKLDAFFASLG